MRVLFLFTNVKTYHACEVYPIGVGTLAAYMKQQGHDVRLFSAVEVDEFPRLRKVLDEFRPELVAYSVISCQGPNIPLLAKIVKDWDPRVPVICGGAYPTLSPREVLEYPGVDVVCCGDGEYALQEYAESLEKGEVDTSIQGLWFKTADGEIIPNEPRPFFEDLDALPPPDREIVDFQRILDDNTGVLWMLASRGCNWNCTFCGITRIKKRGSGEYMRIRSVDHVLAELRDLVPRYRFKVVAFRDDTFTWNKEWTLEFCEKYAKEFDYPLTVFSRADCLDEEIVAALKKANVQDLWIGYESGNDYIRNHVVKKEIDTRQFEEACRLLHQYDIRPCVLNIIGLPHETPEMFEETIAVNRRVYADYPVFALGGGSAPKIFTFEPFPGTPLHDLCDRNGWLRQERIRTGFRAHIDSYVDIPTFPRKKVLQEFRRFRYNVYKGNHNALALFYLFHDSATGEFLREILPTKAIIKGLDFAWRMLGRERRVYDVNVREL